MEITFSRMDKRFVEQYMPQPFDILSANMSRIAPTGHTYEEDYRTWLKANLEAIQLPQREFILISYYDEIIGFFRYVIEPRNTFFMEEIQIAEEYQHAYGIFRALYAYVIPTLPEGIKKVSAYANRKNHKSQAILLRLGLEITQERKNGYLFEGKFEDLQNWLSRK